MMKAARPPRRMGARLVWRVAAFMLLLLGFACYEAVVQGWEPAGEAAVVNPADAAAGGEPTPPHHLRRQLLEDNGNYPPDLFTEEQRSNGAIALHILGVIYMFLGLAIVCDEYFVPALEVITDRVNVSDDVAGATFMAAGGSAPELFTSFIGTFVSKSDVGFGTIVGSAVFNVLFVIGMCAVFSKELLALTWWPLFRDATYYLFSLVILVACFWDQQIKWWEAALLFALYGGYVILMAFNVRLYAWVESKRTGTKVAADSVTSPKGRTVMTRSGSTIRVKEVESGVINLLRVPHTFRVGVMHQLLAHVDPKGKGPHAHKDKRFQRVQQLVRENVRLRRAMLHHAADHAKSRSIVTIAGSNGGSIASPSRGVQVGVSAGTLVSDKPTVAANTITSAPVPSPLRLDPVVATQSPVVAFRDGTDSAAAGGAGIAAAPSNRSRSSRQVHPAGMVTGASAGAGAGGAGAGGADSGRSSREHTVEDALGALGDESEELDEADDEALDVHWPSDGTLREKVLYILLAPLSYSMWLTIPDVRKARWENWYPVSFIASITWIGIFSYFMVWWATLAGVVMHIPDPVMGLTLLAAGTSIPDLLSSVIVARQGAGDMAVSSSIGSNIFDILVGLPLPWLASNIVFGEAVSVQSDSLVFSVMILVIMLFVVVVTIAASGWKMTKRLGFTMFMLYIVFVALSLLIEYDVISPPSLR